MDVTYTPWYVDSLFDGLAWMFTNPLESILGFVGVTVSLLIINQIISS
jgi:hypothetical protein